MEAEELRLRRSAIKNFRVIGLIAFAAGLAEQAFAGSVWLQEDNTTMRVEWAHNGHRLAGFDALLDRYPTTEFDSPTRSTIPLMEYSRSPTQRIRELTDALNLPAPQGVRLDFEHQVHPPRGKGTASHTDLMVISPELSVAIEAKWEESRYKTVGSWLGDSKDRRTVLRGWFDLLERCGAGPIRQRDVRHLPYQMIHRAASACNVNDAANRWLVYLVFDATTTKRREYLTYLDGLREALGPESSLGIALVEYRVAPAPSLADLQQRWDIGERRLHEPVLQRLRQGALLQVQLKRVHRLTP